MRHKNTNIVRFHFCEIVRLVKFIETEIVREVAKNWRLLFKRYRVYNWDDKVF